MTYLHPEIFLDFVEEIEAISDKYGNIISASIKGVVNCKCALSGNPDLTLIFTNARVLGEDITFVSLFHHCSDLMVIQVPSLHPHFAMDKREDPLLRAACQFLLLSFRVHPVLFYFLHQDGRFELASYYLDATQQIRLPIFIKSAIVFDKSGGYLDLELMAKTTDGKAIEDIIVTVTMPQEVTAVSPTPTSGVAGFDPVGGCA